MRKIINVQFGKKDIDILKWLYMIKQEKGLERNMLIRKAISNKLDGTPMCLGKIGVNTELNKQVSGPLGLSLYISDPKMIKVFENRKDSSAFVKECIRGSFIYTESTDYVPSILELQRMEFNTRAKTLNDLMRLQLFSNMSKDELWKTRNILEVIESEPNTLYEMLDIVTSLINDPSMSKEEYPQTNKETHIVMQEQTNSPSVEQVVEQAKLSPPQTAAAFFMSNKL